MPKLSTQCKSCGKTFDLPDRDFKGDFPCPFCKAVHELDMKYEGQQGVPTLARLGRLRISLKK